MSGRLAKMVRDKHPGAYDDMNDAALEAAILAKYPGVYDDLVNASVPSAPQGSAVGRFASGLGEMLNPVTMVKGVAQAVAHPIDTVSAIYDQQGQQFDQAVAAGRQGRYSEMLGHGAASFLPVVGPLAAQIGEQAATGDLAGAAGRATGLISGGAILKAGAQAVPKVLSIGGKGSREAALAKFGLDRGIPVDVASATANPIPRAAQKIATHTTLSGAAIGTKAAKARAQGLATVGEQLAAKGYAPSATRETAGAAVRTGVETSIKGFDDAANQSYTKLRALEQAAPAREMVTKTQAVPVDPKLVDQRFILRWFADDLTDMPYQSASRMRGQQLVDTMTDATSQEAGRRASYTPRVAGSPVQDTLNLAGVSGTKAELASRIDKALQTGKIDPKLSAVADAYAEAWDGQAFDFDLVSDPALVRAGMMRKTMKSPITMPDVSEPGASRFFPESSIPEAPKALATKTMQAPVDLESLRPALQPLLARLNRKKELVGQLQGAEARAVTALDRLVNGDAFAGLSDVDAALGDLKALARGAAMPELRSSGQGAAAFAVQKLDKAVMDATAQLGPEAVAALKSGRIATMRKYAAAEVLKQIKDEPVRSVNAATAAQDASVAHLRELQRYAPASLPQIGKAVLTEMLTEATKEGGFGSVASLASKWEKLGPQTKRLLFPDAAHVKDLDQFWALAKKMGENPNPSGTAYVGGATAAGVNFMTNPIGHLGYELGGGALAQALNSPRVTRALVNGLRVPLRSKAQASSQYGRLANLVEQATKSPASPATAPGASR